MRQGQQNKRMRGRNRSGKGPNPLTRSYESNGGDVKIRGTALHVAEKYVQLARDAQSSGDRVAGENYLQHAEHYYRIVAAAQAQLPQPQPVYRNDEEGDDEEGQDRPDNRGQYGNNNFQGGNNNYGGNRPQMQGGQQPSGQPVYEQQPQPYVNGNGGQEPVAQDDDQQGGGEFRGQQGGGEQRAEGYDNRSQGERGGRHRRRRPYRDNYNDRGGEQRSGGGAGESFEQPAQEPRGDE
jgi:hypothetical protein